MGCRDMLSNVASTPLSIQTFKVG